jgi:hypothetical protein
MSSRLWASVDSRSVSSGKGRSPAQTCQPCAAMSPMRSSGRSPKARKRASSGSAAMSSTAGTVTATASPPRRCSTAGVSRPGEPERPGRVWSGHDTRLVVDLVVASLAADPLQPHEQIDRARAAIAGAAETRRRPGYMRLGPRHDPGPAHPRPEFAGVQIGRGAASYGYGPHIVRPRQARRRDAEQLAAAIYA